LLRALSLHEQVWRAFRVASSGSARCPRSQARRGNRAGQNWGTPPLLALPACMPRGAWGGDRGERRSGSASPPPCQA
jgi:hypothetical protein